jgi:hypothetical protein
MLNGVELSCLIVFIVGWKRAKLNAENAHTTQDTLHRRRMMIVARPTTDESTVCSVGDTTAR